MRSEDAQLLALCRREPAPSSAVDSERFLERARAHELDALAYWCWKHNARLGVPVPDLEPSTLLQLKLGYLHHLMRNESLVGNLEALQGAFTQKGIEPLVFKGPLLAYRAYPDPGTRPVGDLDIGIREDDYHGALEALRTLGYASDSELPRSAAGALRRAHYGKQLRFHARGRRMVELHFRMINVGPPRDEEWVWRHGETLDIGTVRIRVPGPTAMLLHLVLHANQHSFALARLLFDIRFALDLHPIDLDRFLFEVRSLRCSNSIYHGLDLARNLAAARVPRGLLDALRPGVWKRRGFQALWDVPRAHRLEARRGRQDIESPKLYLLEMGSLRDKLHYVTELVIEAGGPIDLVRRAIGRPPKQRIRKEMP